MNRHLQIAIIEWQGINIEVRFEPNWLYMSGPYRTAHLELCSVSPERAPLPISETGYRSHFLSADDVLAEGGPLAYARMWLDVAARDPEWIAAQAQRQQLSLF